MRGKGDRSGGGRREEGDGMDGAPWGGLGFKAKACGFANYPPTQIAVILRDPVLFGKPLSLDLTICNNPLVYFQKTP
jgi:hypothetical protein